MNEDFNQQKKGFAALWQRDTDPVNHPAHYKQGGVECIEAIKAALGQEGFIAYCKGQVVKYLWRAHHKGNALQDAEKAEWYLKRVISEMKEMGK